MNIQTASGTVHQGYRRSNGTAKAKCGTNLGHYGSKTEAPVTCAKCGA